jgi:hypothetical protein
MTEYELTFTCLRCGEEVNPIEHNGLFLIPSGLHSCIDREDSTVAQVTATGVELLADEMLDINVKAHSIYPPEYEEHTLQWARNKDGEISAIQIITDMETSTNAKMGRAQIKMIAGECREVSGSKQVISELRDRLDQFVVEKQEDSDGK